MARNSMERLVASAIWSRENPRFPGHQHGQSIQMWYYAGFKGVLQSTVLLYCVTVVPRMALYFPPRTDVL